MNNDDKNNLSEFLGDFLGATTPGQSPNGEGGLSQLAVPKLPTEGTLKPVDLEDFSQKIPDTCRAMTPAEQLLAEKMGQEVPCPVCHVVGCGSYEAQQAREQAAARKAFLGF